jgi:hypothetical protein
MCCSRGAAPLDVGSRVKLVARFLGRRLRYTYDGAEYVPGEQPMMRTSQGPLAMETTYPATQTRRSGTVMA